MLVLAFGRRSMSTNLSNPKAIADRGEEVYREKYQKEYEKIHRGKFVAIDVTTGLAYVADTPEGAFNLARKASQAGLFHLIKVGEPGAYRVSYTSDAKLDWLFQ